MTGRIRSAVLVTAAPPEPRTFGKQVVIGGLLDHLCARLGADRVEVLQVGDPVGARPPTPYAWDVLPRPGGAEQLRSVVTRVAVPPFSPLQEAALWSTRLRTRLAGALAAVDADLEIWDTMRVGQYVHRLDRPRPGVRRVLYADDLFSLRYASMLNQIAAGARIDNPLGEFSRLLPGPARTLGSWPAVYRRLLGLERRLAARSERRAPEGFDATVLVSEAETRLLAELSGNRTVRTLLPLLPDRPFRGRQVEAADRATFVFLGGLDFAPNRDGLTWFLTECREQVLAAVPDFRLLLVGRGSDDPPPAAEAWGGRVRPLGWVDDLDQVLLGVAGMISPLRIGSGIKIKVLEALSRGLPVVATPHGVLGLGVGPDQGCLVADPDHPAGLPHGLAAGLAELADPSRNADLSAAARHSWTRTYAPDVVARAYDDVLGLPLDREVVR